MNKAGVAPQSDGTTPQRPFHPCRFQSTFPTSARHGLAHDAGPCAADHRHFPEALAERYSPNLRDLSSEDTGGLSVSSQRRITVHDLMRHTMLLCGADAPTGRAPCGNLARELSNAISSEKGKGRGTKGPSQPYQTEISLSTLTQKLMERWRSRRQSLSEPQAHACRN